MCLQHVHLRHVPQEQQRKTCHTPSCKVGPCEPFRHCTKEGKERKGRKEGNKEREKRRKEDLKRETADEPQQQLQQLRDGSSRRLTLKVKATVLNGEHSHGEVLVLEG